MRAIVALAPQAEVDSELLQNITRFAVDRNQYPDEGIRIVNADIEPDWEWAKKGYVFNVGGINFGDHTTIPIEAGSAKEVATEIGDALSSLTEDAEDGDMSGD